MTTDIASIAAGRKRRVPQSRKAVIAEIQRIAAPHMRDSGYRRAIDPSKGIFGGTRPLRIWALDPPIEIGGYALEDVLAVTEDGIMEDASGGGAVTGNWDCYPVEDLRALCRHLALRTHLLEQSS